MGAHLITPRIGFAHYGIYVGVVHGVCFAHHWRWSTVEEVSLARFSRGHCVWVRSHAVCRFGREEVIDRARLRLGEGSDPGGSAGLTRRRWLDLEGHERLGDLAFDRTAPRSTPGVRRLASHPPEAAREVCLIDHSTADGNLTERS